MHAVLLYGQVPADTRRLAERLVKHWLCPNTADGQPCGTCGVCRSFEAGRAVDLLLISPMPPSNLIRLAAISRSEGETDGSWSLQEFFRTRPLSGAHKVALIEQADRMNPNAANALLKTLEEPWPYARMVLTIEAPSAVLPTIASRCLCIACEATPTSFSGVETPKDLAKLFASNEDRGDRALAAYEGLATMLDWALDQPRSAALLVAERFRDQCETIQGALDVNARASQAEALRCLVLWMRARTPARAGRLELAIETHRRVLGNAQAPLALDALFASILMRSS